MLILITGISPIRFSKHLRTPRPSWFCEESPSEQRRVLCVPRSHLWSPGPSGTGPGPQKSPGCASAPLPTLVWNGWWTRTEGQACSATYRRRGDVHVWGGRKATSLPELVIGRDVVKERLCFVVVAFGAKLVLFCGRVQFVLFLLAYLRVSICRQSRKASQLE